MIVVVGIKDLLLLFDHLQRRKTRLLPLHLELLDEQPSTADETQGDLAA